MRKMLACAWIVGILSTMAAAQTQTVLMNLGVGGNGVGDLTGDGIPDFRIPGLLNNVPLLLSGYDGSVIGGIPDFGYPGEISTQVAGDLDGDGTSDLLCSRVETVIPASSPYPPYYRVTIWGYSLATATQIFTFAMGTGAANWTGPDVRNWPHVYPLEDVNGDGTDDFAVSVGSTADEIITGGLFNTWVVTAGFGRVYSSTNLAVLEGITINSDTYGTYGEYRWPVSCSYGTLGDVNGDGMSDYTRRLTRYSGAQTSFRLGPNGTSYFLVTSNSIFTQKIGDVNGDGKDDLAYYSVSGPNAGVAGVVRGYDIDPIYIYAPGSGQPSGYGYGGTLGDINHDGRADFVTTAATVSQVRSGMNGSILATFPNTTLAAAGDINGDGYADVFVGTNVVSFRPNHTAPSVVTIGAGAPGSPVSLSVGAPTLGGPAVLSLTGSPTPGDAILMASIPPAQPFTVGSGLYFSTPCTVWIDLSAVLAFPIDLSGGSFTLSATVPQIPTAEGLTLNIQAALWPTSGGFYTTNAVQVVYGY